MRASLAIDSCLTRLREAIVLLHRRTERAGDSLPV